MIQSISIAEKQAFLKQFLKKYRLQKKECRWMLHYLLQRPHMLNHVHFVRDMSYCPRAMLITSSCSINIPFLFYKNGVMTTDVEKAFHDIRLNKTTSLYVQLQFKQANQDVSLAGILERNPYLKHEQIITKEDKIQARQLLQHTINAYQKQLLREQIDEALDHKNKELFDNLVKMLRRYPSN